MSSDCLLFIYSYPHPSNFIISKPRFPNFPHTYRPIFLQPFFKNYFITRLIISHTKLYSITLFEQRMVQPKPQYMALKFILSELDISEWRNGVIDHISPPLVMQARDFRSPIISLHYPLHLVTKS